MDAASCLDCWCFLSLFSWIGLFRRTVFSLPKLSDFRFWAVKHVFVMLYIFGASLYFLYGDRVTREFAPFLSFRH